MADVNTRSGSVRNRSIRRTDLIFGADPNESDAAQAFRADTFGDLFPEWLEPGTPIPAEKLPDDHSGTVTVGDGLAGTGADDDPVELVLKDGDLNIQNLAGPGETPRPAVALDPTFRDAALETSEQRVVTPRPAASADTVDKLVLDDGHGWLTKATHIARVPGQGNFADYPLAGSYRGVQISEPDPSGITVGSWQFNPDSRTPRIVAAAPPPVNSRFWRDATWSELGVVFIGSHPSDAEALPRVTANGQVYFNFQANALRRVSGFVAAQDAHDVYNYERLVEDGDLDELRSDQESTNRQLGDLNSRTSGIALYEHDSWAANADPAVAAFAVSQSLLGSVAAVVGLPYTTAQATPADDDGSGAYHIHVRVPDGTDTNTVRLRRRPAGGDGSTDVLFHGGLVPEADQGGSTYYRVNSGRVDLFVFAQGDTFTIEVTAHTYNTEWLDEISPGSLTRRIIGAAAEDGRVRVGATLTAESLAPLIEGAAVDGDEVAVHSPLAVTALPPGGPTGLYNLVADHHVPAVEQRFVLDSANSGVYYGTSRADFGSVPPALGTAGDLPAASGLAAVWFQAESAQPNADGTIRVLLREDLGAPSAIHLSSNAAADWGDNVVLALTPTGVPVAAGGVTYRRYTTGTRTFTTDDWGLSKWRNSTEHADDRVYVGIAFGAGADREYLNRDGTKADPVNTAAGLYFRTPAGRYELVQVGPPGDPVDGGRGPEWARWNINPADANAAAGIGGVTNQVGSPLTISGASHLVLPPQSERVIGLMLESYVGSDLHQRVTTTIADGSTTIETGPDRTATFSIVDLVGSTDKRLALTPEQATTAAAAATVRVYAIFGGVGADGDPGPEGPAGQRGPAPALTFVRVGSTNLATTPGVTNRDLPNPVDRRQLSAIHPVQFTGAVNGYAAATGILTLPAGTWDIKTSIDYLLDYGSDGQQVIDVYTSLYVNGALYSAQVDSGANGTDPDMAHNIAVHLDVDAPATVQVLANWQYNRANRFGASVQIQAGRLTAAMLATADASTVTGGSGTSPDGTPRPYTVLLYGRFADSALASGEPAAAPNIVILSDGPSVAPGVWHLDPSAAAGADPLWRAETRAFYHNGAWGHGVFTYSRVNPADGAFQYASDATGTGASEDPFDGWTHYRIRAEDGTLGDWLPRSGNPSTDAVIWALLTNFGAGSWATEAVRDLDDFRDLYCTWGQYTAGYAERAFFRASDRFPASGIRSITAAEADANLLRDGRVLRCQITPTRSGLYLRNEAPSGATESVGCDLAFVFVRAADGLTDRQFDQIRILAGSAGAGRIDIWGRA